MFPWGSGHFPVLHVRDRRGRRTTRVLGRWHRLHHNLVQVRKPGNAVAPGYGVWGARPDDAALPVRTKSSRGLMAYETKKHHQPFTFLSPIRYVAGANNFADFGLDDIRVGDCLTVGCAGSPNLPCMPPGGSCDQPTGRCWYYSDGTAFAPETTENCVSVSFVSYRV